MSRIAEKAEKTLHPALKRWAFLCRPYGTQTSFPPDPGLRFAPSWARLSPRLRRSIFGIRGPLANSNVSSHRDSEGLGQTLSRLRRSIFGVHGPLADSNVSSHRDSEGLGQTLSRLRRCLGDHVADQVAAAAAPLFFQSEPGACAPSSIHPAAARLVFQMWSGLFHGQT